MSTETTVNFYHLTRASLDEALPQLVEKAVKHGFKVQVLTSNDLMVEAIDAMLWTYKPEAFLPHGTEKTGNPEDQPVWITDKFENPNGATLLVLTEGAVPENFDGFEKVLNVFEGGDDEAVKTAREQWKAFKEQGFPLTYYQQNEKGGWETKATG
ncbi:MAG: DNA polymerase III subunit chi [Alphaproteobacteria bacterium]